MFFVGSKPETFDKVIIRGIRRNMPEFKATGSTKDSVRGYLWSPICDRMLIGGEL